MTDVYQTTRNKEKTVAELKTSTKALIESDTDMLICEVMYVLKFLLQSLLMLPPYLNIFLQFYIINRYCNCFAIFEFR